MAVIRVSGPNAREAILKMTKCKELPKPRMASLQLIRDPQTLEELDKGLILWFPGIFLFGSYKLKYVQN